MPAPRLPTIEEMPTGDAAEAPGAAPAAVPRGRDARLHAMVAKLGQEDFLNNLADQAYAAVYEGQGAVRSALGSTKAMLETEFVHIGQAATRHSSFDEAEQDQFLTMDALLSTDDSGGSVTAHLLRYATVEACSLRVDKEGTEKQGDDWDA